MEFQSISVTKEAKNNHSTQFTNLVGDVTSRASVRRIMQRAEEHGIMKTCVEIISFMLIMSE